MKFTLTKEELLKPLQQVIGVVDKKNLQQALSFVLLDFSDNELTVTATDLDIELCSKTEVVPQEHIGKVALPAKKLLDICKALPDTASIQLALKDNNKLDIISNKSRFSLSTLDLEQESYPASNHSIKGFSFSIKQRTLKGLLSSTSFAVASQDVRHFLMGMLWEFYQHEFKVVASDGHRLAVGRHEDKKIFPNNPVRIIIPRKSIVELCRLLSEEEEEARVTIDDRTVQVLINNIVFTTKLIDYQFPDYTKVFPPSENLQRVDICKSEFKQILTRVSILCNEKNRAVRLCFNSNQLVIMANNPEQEEAEESLEIDNTRLNDELTIELCLNVVYLLDVLNKVDSEKICFYFDKPNTPVLLKPDNSQDVYSYIIMPMCL